MTDVSYPQRYSFLTRWLHWLVAVLIIVAYGVGIWREYLPKDDFRAWLLLFHMSLGMLVFGLCVLRIFLRLVQKAPAPAPGSALMVLAVKLGHLALYLALIIIPVIGLFAAWYKGRIFGFFSFFPLPSPVIKDVDFAKKLEELHEICAHLMMLLAFGHAFVALVHQYVFKDGLLNRISLFSKN